MSMQIWDTAGSPSFGSIVRIFYRGAHVCVLMFDLTKKETFEAIPDLASAFRSNNSDECSQIFLLGNKLDLCTQDNTKREVSYQEALNYALSEEMWYFEISSKSRIAIEESIDKMAQVLYQRVLERNQP
mmetsp:Transcript_529/g.577  ORF Transcript_529/g.577 Transcript_529/m.577 type:complete len:129 (-) Transcript_529:18-404(-)